MNTVFLNQWMLFLKETASLLCKLLENCFYFYIFATNSTSQQYNAGVIKYTTQCVAEKDKITQTDSVTIQINNREGDEYSEIVIPYSKSEKVSNINGWIENVDGKKGLYNE
jgi:hypothetical protein